MAGGPAADVFDPARERDKVWPAIILPNWDDGRGGGAAAKKTEEESLLTKEDRRRQRSSKKCIHRPPPPRPTPLHYSVSELTKKRCS